MTLDYDVAFNNRPIPEGAAKTRAITNLIAKPGYVRTGAGGIVAVSAAFSVYNIATAENKVKATVTEAGGLGGAWMGAATGATWGAAVGGPFAPVTGAIGGLIGGAVGWWIGSNAAQAGYEAVSEND